MSDIQADVVIVGSGVAGALLAERLARAGVGVAILEAGPRIDRSEALWALFPGAVQDPGKPLCGDAGSRLPPHDKSRALVPSVGSGLVQEPPT